MQCTKAPKQLPNCLKRPETSIDLIVFLVNSVTSVLILLSFLTVAQHEPGPRKKNLYLGQYIKKQYENNEIVCSNRINAGANQLFLFIVFDIDIT